MSLRLSFLLIASLFTWLASNEVPAADAPVRFLKGGEATVCREPGIQGYEASAKRAKASLPSTTTSDPRKAFIYIENTKDGPYYHSNFMSDGAEYPTKIGGGNVTDGVTAFINIVYTDRPSPEVWGETEKIFRGDVQILLDRSIFDSNGVPLVDLKDAKNVHVVDGNAGHIISDIAVETLPRSKPPPLLLSKIIGCCFFGIPPQMAPKYGAALKARPFDSKQVRFLSLVRDSATETAINKASEVKKKRLRNAPIAQSSDIEALFKEATGKTVILVGHVEGERYVTRDAKNDILLQFPIDKLRSLARLHSVELIDLGCRTAQQIKADSLGVGVTTRFNTVDAVSSINRAILQSKNYADFFQNLTASGLKVVVDKQFIEGSSLRAEIYSKRKSKTSPFWVKIAEAFVTFRERFSVKEAMSKFEQMYPDKLQALRKLSPNYYEELEETFFAGPEGLQKVDRSSDVSQSAITINNATYPTDKQLGEDLQLRRGFTKFAELLFPRQKERAHHGRLSVGDSNQRSNLYARQAGP